MNAHPTTPAVAFRGEALVASGRLAEVVVAVKALLERESDAQVLILDGVTSRPIEVDLRGSVEEVVRRLLDASEEPVAQAEAESVREPESRRGPGRPKLGVVAREVTLLPRHWEWLATQRGGASVALRRLVDEARKANEAQDRARQAQESAYRFMTTVAGDLPGYEEATRALFAGDVERFAELVAPWPKGVRVHAMELAARSFVEPTEES